LEKSRIITVELDDHGNLILPAELLAVYGIIPGAQIKLDTSAIGFSLSRSSDNLARVYIEPTNVCNLECATCIRNSWDELPGKMSFDSFERIMDGIASITPKPSVFFGGFGEPLTHPRILDMVANAKKVAENVELITNGILLTPEVSKALINLGLDRLWVSLDGATPKSYADVRLGDMLPRVLANLKEFQSLKKKLGSANPHLGIAFVAMKRNISDLPDIVEIGKSLGADLFSISNVLPHTPEMVKDALYVGPHNGETPMSEWSPVLSLPRMEMNEFTTNPILAAIRKAGSVSITRKELPLGADVCPFVEKGSVSIRWDGAVAPCLALLHENENFLDFRKRKTQAYIIGNINQNQLLDIWNSTTYSELRKRLLAFNFAYCTICNSCDLVDSNIEDCFGTPAPACGGCLWAQGFIQCP